LGVSCWGKARKAGKPKKKDKKTGGVLSTT